MDPLGDYVGGPGFQDFRLYSNSSRQLVAVQISTHQETSQRDRSIHHDYCIPEADMVTLQLVQTCSYSDNVGLKTSRGFRLESNR